MAAPAGRWGRRAGPAARRAEAPARRAARPASFRQPAFRRRRGRSLRSRPDWCFFDRLNLDRRHRLKASRGHEAARRDGLNLLQQFLLAGLADAGFFAELVERLPERRFAGVECDLSVLELILRVVQDDDVPGLLLQFVHGFGDRGFLEDEVNLRRLEDVLRFGALFNAFDQLGRAAADFGVVALGGLAQRLQGRHPDGVKVLVGLFALIELGAAQLLNELVDLGGVCGFSGVGRQGRQNADGQSREQDGGKCTSHH